MGDCSGDAYLEVIKCLAQSSFTVLQQPAHFTLTEELLQAISVALSLDIGIYLVHGSEFHHDLCELQSRWYTLCEYAQIVQCLKSQFTSSFRVYMEVDDCRNNLLNILDQMDTFIPVLLDILARVNIENMPGDFL